MFSLYNREYYREENCMQHLIFSYFLYPYPTINVALQGIFHSSSYLYSLHIIYIFCSSSHFYSPNIIYISHFFSHFYSPHVVSTRPSSSHNLFYSIRKFNITIIYQLKNILYNILYKKRNYTN